MKINLFLSPISITLGSHELPRINFMHLELSERDFGLVGMSLMNISRLIFSKCSSQKVSSWMRQVPIQTQGEAFHWPQVSGLFKFTHPGIRHCTPVCQ